MILFRFSIETSGLFLCLGFILVIVDELLISDFMELYIAFFIISIFLLFVASIAGYFEDNIRTSRVKG